MMNREDIIRMAREAGFGVLLPSGDGRGEIYAGDEEIQEDMERFAALVAAAEREQCDALRAEVERYRTAITYCIDFAAGREYEWGERAINAFGILEAALRRGEK